MPGPLPTACLPLERLTPRALYVHLPFCARRCPYCDFATAPLDAAREARYLGALELELRARAPTGFRPWTVYLGGGTPTELTTPGIERLVELLRPYVADAREVTVEANPRTLLARKLLRLRELGVDRVSLGAQSFAPELLESGPVLVAVELSDHCVRATRWGQELAASLGRPPRPRAPCTRSPRATPAAGTSRP